MLAVMGGCGRGTHPQLGDWDDTEWVLLAWVRVCLWQEQTAFGPAEPKPSMVSLRQAQGFRGGAAGKVGGGPSCTPFLSTAAALSLLLASLSPEPGWPLLPVLSLCVQSPDSRGGPDWPSVGQASTSVQSAEVVAGSHGIQGNLFREGHIPKVCVQLCGCASVCVHILLLPLYTIPC